MRTIGEHKQEPKQDKQAKLAVQHQQKTNNNPLFNNNPCHGLKVINNLTSHSYVSPFQGQ